MNTSEMGVRYRYLLYLSTSSTLKYSSCLPEKAQYKIGILKSEMVTPINCSKIKETVYGEEGPFDNKNKQHLLVSKIQNMGKTIRKMLLALLLAKDPNQQIFEEKTTSLSSSSSHV